MMRGVAVTLLLLSIGPIATCAAAGPADQARSTRILVTISDPGMSNATRAGPAGPAYRRRSSAYLASVGVKRAANRIAAEFELVTLDEWPIVALKVYCLVYGVADGVQVEDLLARLRQRPEVESAQLMNEFEVTGTRNVPSGDPYAGLQHNLSTLELTQAHIWSMGAGTSVTIIDTGADLEHPDLKTQISDHHDFVADDADGEFSTDTHGTAVAGVIAAAADNGIGMIGVAPSTRLSVLKACWHRQGALRAVCNSFTLAKALSHAIESGTDIINLSLGGPSDALLGRLLDHALSSGIVVVAAAPSRLRPGFPADVAGVIVVRSDELAVETDASRPFSINAPGQEILVPVPGGGYDYASGSSLSAANVSGIVALLVARRHDLTTDQISTLLVNSQAAVNTSVNACRALAQLLQRSGCRDRETVSQRD